jgi:hypothetical protein
MDRMNRRTFLRISMLTMASSAVGQTTSAPGNVRRILILSQFEDDVKARLARRELQRGLQALFPAVETSLAQERSRADAGVLNLTLDIREGTWSSREDYRISLEVEGVVIAAATSQALLYAVFDLIEQQGTVFGLDGETVPVDRPHSFTLPSRNQPWNASPEFAVRGMLPWPDFWNCISVYNQEDFQSYFANMLRMRLNMFGMHVYTQNDPLAESYLSFDFAGAGHRAALEDTTVTSWGYLPQRTSTFRMGGSQFFDRETFGADATRLSADNWEIADRTRDLLRGALSYASDLGIHTGIGFEPYANPAEIVRALPPEAKSYPGGIVESRTGKDLLERRLANLLERYPKVDYVWLWEDETTNWNSRNKNIPLSTTPFMQAHDFLRRNAPDKRLVLAGWGGIVRNFESLHKRLPGDITFAALNDTIGWDPVNEAFGKLEQRERWVIPWLEDDPAMWFPQFRASHIEQDLHRARNFGCQGAFGIHWRHRIVDPTATYFSRAMWNHRLTPSDHYRSFSAAQASGDRVEKLARLLDESDEKRAIVSTYLGGQSEKGFANKIELTPDYAEGFSYDMDQPALPDLTSQRQVDEQLRSLVKAAISPTEKERLQYFAGFVHLMLPYCEAYETAQKLNAILKDATKLRADSKENEAQSLVLREGVPLWLSIAPRSREVMLAFQRIIATRNDQGQLASMQNKFVRISLERLRLSVKEFLAEPPQEMESAYRAAIADDGELKSRVFIPTRPSILRVGERIRLFVVVPTSGKVASVRLKTRTSDAPEWKESEAELAGRHVYSIFLGPFAHHQEWVEYHVTAAIRGEDVLQTAPKEVDRYFYRATVMN